MLLAAMTPPHGPPKGRPGSAAATMDGHSAAKAGRPARKIVAKTAQGRTLVRAMADAADSASRDARIIVTRRQALPRVKPGTAAATGPMQSGGTRAPSASARRRAEMRDRKSRRAMAGRRTMASMPAMHMDAAMRARPPAIGTNTRAGAGTRRQLQDTSIRASTSSAGRIARTGAPVALRPEQSSELLRQERAGIFSAHFFGSAAFG
jgi:hypothetical protein